MVGDKNPEPETKDARFVECVRLIAVDRDRTAFTQLFDFFAPRLKSFLMRQGCSPEEAEEVTQDAMITLWHKAHLFDPEKSALSTWLFRVARNRRIDLLRRKKTSELDEEDPALQPAAMNAPDGYIDADQRDDEIRKTLLSLPEEQLTLVKLSFFQNMTHSQISQQTGLPLGTVKSRIRLAFNRLRKLIEENAKIDTD